MHVGLGLNGLMIFLESAQKWNAISRRYIYYSYIMDDKFIMLLLLLFDEDDLYWYDYYIIELLYKLAGY